MPFSVKDFRDLVELLEAHPEWRSELRRLLLSDEVLELPLVVRELVEAQRATDARLDKLTEQVQGLAEGQRVLTARVDALTEQVQGLAEGQRVLTARVDALTEQVQGLAEGQRVLTARLDALTARVDALTEQVQGLAEGQRVLAARLDALTARLDALTARVDALTEQVQGLAEGQRMLTARIDSLTERMEQLTARMERVEWQIEQLTGKVSDLATWQRGEAGRREGERYEDEMVRRGVVLFNGGEGGTTLDPVVRQRLRQWLASLPEPLDISDRERDPTLADLIWWKGDQVVVVEISLKINGKDLKRAIERAHTLQRAKVNAQPVVVGKDWASLEVQAQAEEKGVWWIVDGMPSEGVVEFRKIAV